MPHPSEMKSETEDETHLFLAPRPVRENNKAIQDDWDDTELIKAYDKAVSKAKRQILKRLQVELGLTETDIQEAFSDVSITKKKKKRRKKVKGSNAEWRVGDACRAVYSEDGQEYEAEIVSIIDSQRCIVKFLGYDNEQEELLGNLMLSLGENVIQLQLESAVAYNNALNNEESAMEESEAQEPYLNMNRPVESVKLKSSEFKQFSPQIPKMFSQNHPQRPPMFNPDHPPFTPGPPFPPFDPAFSPQFPLPDQMRAGMFPNQMFPSASKVAAQSMSEDLNSLLISWYMCGYYTGYFQRSQTNK